MSARCEMVVDGGMDRKKAPGGGGQLPSPASNVSLWLKADIQPPEIDVRFTPESRRSLGRH